jgi:hypothetical protein
MNIEVYDPYLERQRALNELKQFECRQIDSSLTMSGINRPTESFTADHEIISFLLEDPSA